MLMASRYPTRLTVRCPACRGVARVDRADYSRAQMFCSVDGLPLAVIAVRAGALLDSETSDDEGPVLSIVSRPRPLTPEPAAVRYAPEVSGELVLA